MNLKTLDWDPFLLKYFDIPPEILPDIKTCSDRFGELKRSRLKGVPITGCIGDQQAALLGQQCLAVGQTKATYGTGCFVLTNIGNLPIIQPGLITTVAYKLGSAPANFAIEGSIAQAGSAVHLLAAWGLNRELLETATSSEGVQVLPAFSGLLAPNWRPEARGVISGISSFTIPQHILYATLEAISFQVRELLECIEGATGTRISELLVDGGLSQSDNLLQVQADLSGLLVVRPSMLETTALGAAIAAAVGAGLQAEARISNSLDRKDDLSLDKFTSRISTEERLARYGRWQEFVESTAVFDTKDAKSGARPAVHNSIESSLPASIFLFSSFLIYMLSHRL